MTIYGNNLSITEMKNLLNAYKDIVPRLNEQLKSAYRQGYIDGRRYSGTLLSDIPDEELTF